MAMAMRSRMTIKNITNGFSLLKPLDRPYPLNQFILNRPISPSFKSKPSFSTNFSSPGTPPPPSKWFKWLELTDLVVGKVVRYSGFAGCLLLGAVGYDALKSKGPKVFYEELYRVSRDGLDSHISTDDFSLALRDHEDFMFTVKDDLKSLADEVKKLQDMVLMIGLQTGEAHVRPVFFVNFADPTPPSPPSHCPFA